jgi:hypothetical protein
MDWAKPKLIIKKYIFNLGIIMIVITGVLLVFGLIWIKKPYLIDRLDELMPDLYHEKIGKKYALALVEDDVYEKYLIYDSIYNEVKDLSSMKRYFNYKKNINIYLTDYYLSVNEVGKAMNIARYWSRNSPRNFDAKYNYIKVLSHISTEETVGYYEGIVALYPDILNK